MLDTIKVQEEYLHYKETVAVEENGGTVKNRGKVNRVLNENHLSCDAARKLFSFHLGMGSWISLQYILSMKEFMSQVKAYPIQCLWVKT